MRNQVVMVVSATILALAGLSCSGESRQAEPQSREDILAGTIEGLIIRNLMTSRLEGVEGTEVIVSHVEIPANTTLPKHWHPGEEFVYVLEGSAAAWLKDKPDTHLKEGDVFKVPSKQIHTATAGSDGVTVLVFRVHESGQPMRVNVE